MSKVDIVRLDSVTSNDTTATASINTNFRNIQIALENTLSRDGTTPNYMTAVLDMNSHRIINTAEPVDDLDVINKAYLNTFIGDIEDKVAAVDSAAQAALDKATQAAQAATIAASSSQAAAASAREAQQSAYDAAQDAYASSQAADRIQGYLEDPNLVAVGEDLQSPDSYIKSVLDAAGDIESRLDDISAAEGYASDASGSADAAAGSAADAKKWAIGDPSEPDGYSAKHWATEAENWAATVHNGNTFLDWKFTDHLLGPNPGAEVNWWVLSVDCAIQFKNSNAANKNIFNHLVADLTDATQETETVAGVSITYYRAQDGHKIYTGNDLGSNTCPIKLIYTATGTAWYYGLDIDGQKFVLPCTKYFATGIDTDTENAGDYRAPGLPNITGSVGSFRVDYPTSNGAFTTTASSGIGDNRRSGVQIDFDASRSSSIYGNSTTVQPPANAMYLYFYAFQETGDVPAGVRYATNLSYTSNQIQLVDQTSSVMGNAITVDNIVTENSNNPVSSDAVFDGLSGKQDTSNLVTSLSNVSTDTQYPSAKCVYDIIGDVETLLASI